MAITVNKNRGTTTYFTTPGYPAELPPSHVAVASREQVELVDAAATQRVKDIEQKGQWVLAFAAPLVALLLAGLAATLASPAFENNPRLWGSAATLFIAALAAATTAAVAAAVTIWTATYDGHDADGIFDLARRSERRLTPAEMFEKEAAGAHGRAARSKGLHATRKVRSLRVALVGIVVAVAASPFIGVTYVVALSDGGSMGDKPPAQPHGSTSIPATENTRGRNTAPPTVGHGQTAVPNKPVTGGTAKPGPNTKPRP